jgi:hypothetical protein
MEEKRRQEGMRPGQETVAGKVESPVSAWADQSRDLIMSIDGDFQLQETKPGLQFSEDLAQLLDPEITESRESFSYLLDSLYKDLTEHEFTIHPETGHIHMASETGPADLGNLFKDFSKKLAQFPIPSFDKELAEKRDRLVTAFADRGHLLAGE